eukprot:15093885-Alexandrium_andersonii.AAC.1
MAWAKDGLTAALALGKDGADAAARLVAEKTRGRCLKMSSTCSGILTPELAARMCVHAINASNEAAHVPENVIPPAPMR